MHLTCTCIINIAFQWGRFLSRQLMEACYSNPEGK